MNNKIDDVDVLKHLLDSEVKTIFVCCSAKNLTGDEISMLEKFLDHAHNNAWEIVIVNTPGTSYVVEHMNEQGRNFYTITTDPSLEGTDNEKIILVDLGIDSLPAPDDDSIILVRLEQYAMDHCYGLYCISEGRDPWIATNYLFGSVLKKKSVYQYKDGNVWKTEMSNFN